MSAPPEDRLETDPEVHLTSTDSGVPVLWSPHPGLMRGKLLFRVGQADEALSIRGVTHLAEHLALSTLGQPTFQFNGGVEDVLTSFEAAGEPDEVAAFFGHVCHALHALPMGRIETEKQILRMEESGSASPLDAIRRHRFGVQGFGLSSCSQLGLNRLDHATVAHWANQAFTAGNAVLWLSGPPPAHLELPLPMGPRRSTPEPGGRSLNGPSWYPGRGPNLVMSAVGTRRPGLLAGAWWLRRLLHWRLRMVDGQTYTPQAELIGLSRGIAELVVFLEGQAGVGDRLLGGFLETLDHACVTSIPEQELTAWQRSIGYALAEPSAALGLLERSARAMLLGEPVLDAAGVRDEAEQVTADAVRVDLRGTLDTALLQTPADAQALGSAWAPLEQAYTPPVRTGITYLPDRQRPQAARLAVGKDGISVRSASGEITTVHWISLAAVLRWRDGRRTVIGNSGTSITVTPGDWTNVAGALAEIDANTPDAFIVPMPDEAHEVPKPRPSGIKRLLGPKARYQI